MMKEKTLERRRLSNKLTKYLLKEEQKTRYRKN